MTRSESIPNVARIDSLGMNIYAVLLDYDYRQLIDSSTKGSVATPQTDFRSILGTAEEKKRGRRIWIWKWNEQTQQIPEPQVFLTDSVTCYLLCSLLQSSHLISSMSPPTTFSFHRNFFFKDFTENFLQKRLSLCSAYYPGIENSTTSPAVINHIITVQDSCVCFFYFWTPWGCSLILPYNIFRCNFSSSSSCQEQEACLQKSTAATPRPKAHTHTGHISNI
jgi:hypothetical protein